MSLLNLIAAIRQAFPEALRDQAYADLMALDDRALADIGLRRPQIVAGLYRGAHDRCDADAPRQHAAVADQYFPLL